MTTPANLWMKRRQPRLPIRSAAPTIAAVLAALLQLVCLPHPTHAATGDGSRDIGFAQPAISPLGICGYRAVFLAVDNYVDDAIPDLKAPVKDATSIYEVLRDQYGVDGTIEPDPTKAEFLEQLDALAQVKSCEAIIVYYAGHGEIIDEGGITTYYWLPSDASADKHRRTNWIETSEVVRRLDKLPANHVLLIVDSCFAGNIGTQRFRSVVTPPSQARSGSEGTPIRGVAESFAHRRSRWYIASGGNERVQDVYTKGMSLFAYYLYQSLKGARTEIVIPSVDPFNKVLRNVVEASGPGGQIPEQGKLRDADHAGGQLVLCSGESCSDPSAAEFRKGASTLRSLSVGVFAGQLTGARISFWPAPKSPAFGARVFLAAPGWIIGEGPARRGPNLFVAWQAFASFRVAKGWSVDFGPWWYGETGSVAVGIGIGAERKLSGHAFLRLGGLGALDQTQYSVLPELALGWHW